MAFLGFDTSNYTTSVAIYEPESNSIYQRKRLLNVRQGEKGLRQSEAVFQHTVAMPELVDKLFKEHRPINFDAVCASVQPRLAEGSYMPCFLVGKNSAICAANSSNAEFYSTSHQHGHILAALYSAERLDLIKREFIAFHLSGGTTEALLITPDEEEIFRCRLIARSLDVKAGQIIDRTGVMLGMKFPCGAELDRLSSLSKKTFKIKTSMKGADCSLSGVENKVKKLVEEDTSKEDIALFAIEYIISTIDCMLDKLLEEYGEMPVLFAGGVSSNSLMQRRFKEKYNAIFAAPAFSSDNASGVAIMAYLKYINEHSNSQSDQPLCEICH